MGNSITVGLGIGSVTVGGSYGGTQGDSFVNMRKPMNETSRSYRTYGGGQSSQYPSVVNITGKVSVEATIDATRTWVLKF